MPQKASTTWSGGSIKLDTADKKQLIAHPQQQHNLSLAPNRNVLLTAQPGQEQPLSPDPRPVGALS